MTDQTGFHGQFIIHRGTNILQQSWKQWGFADWYIERHPALPVIPIVTNTGRPFGCFLGYTISPENEYLPEKAIVPGGTHYEDWLYSWRGRWCALIQMPGQSPRLHLDAIGSLACIYSAEHQCIASSPLLIPGAKMDDEIVQAYGMPESGRFYPAGLTPFVNVERLLPNHYLDLETMTTHRHWPLQDFKHKANTDQLVAEIAERLAQNISAVVRKQPAYLSLTAGRDSRMLLAAAESLVNLKNPTLAALTAVRGKQDRIIFFTYDDAPVDMHIAERIAKRHRLPWRPLQESTTHDWGVMEDWQRDVGNCVSGAIWEHSTRFYHLSNRLFQPERVRMCGLAGEIGRAYYWRKDDQENWWAGSSATGVLLHRMKLLIDHPATWERMETWLKSVPSWMNTFDELVVPPWMNTYDLFDLAYIEHRLGCWAGPSLYGSDRYFAGQIVPLADRYIIERMMSLPPEYRLDQRMASDVISYAWPELLDLPFNRYTGLKRYFSRHGLRQVARSVKRKVGR